MPHAREPRQRLIELSRDRHATTDAHWHRVDEHLPSDETRWCHIDLAGPVHREDRGTSYGVALLAELVQSV